MFRYFLPSIDRKTFLETGVELLRSLGLGDVFRDVLMPGRFAEEFMLGEVMHSGPGNKSGLVIVAKSPGALPSRVGYHPKQQTWHDAGTYWIGIDRDEPPTEVSLRRKKLIDGPELMLGNGEAWTAPIIRRFEVDARRWDNQLPLVYGMDPLTREVEARIDPDWEWAWELSAKIFDWCYVAGSTAISRADTFRVACECLSINYRLGPIEAGLLKLLGSDNCHEVFGAAIDVGIVREFFESEQGQAELEEALEDVAKKNEADGPPSGASSSPGPKADSPATAPVAASCTS